MKLYYTLAFIIALAISFASCKKVNDTTVPITGKWQQTKLRLYVDSSNKILRDTTYLHPFTNLDYVQFNADGTCTFSSDHYYYPNELNYPTTPQAIAQSLDTLCYSGSGSQYVISDNLLNLSGFYFTDMAYISGNTLHVQVINYGISKTSGYESVTDSYYERSTP